MYLVEVRYTSEAERKRLEYLLSRFGKSVSRPTGYTFYVNEDVYEGLTSELGAKFPYDNISVYKIERKELEVPIESQRLNFSFDKKTSEVMPFISYLISKRRGVLTMSKGEIEDYEIYFRKGRVELTISHKDDPLSKIMLIVKGSKEATDMITKELEEALTIFGGVKSK